MDSSSIIGDNSRLKSVQQVIKWAVYALLIVNFVYYLYEDTARAFYTLDAQSTFLDWTSAFATSIDESAWFVLLFMFELETYTLEDTTWTGWVAYTVHGARLFCYVMLAHTIFAFAATVVDLKPTMAVEDRATLCDMLDDDIYYVYNLEYSEVDENTCSDLSDGSQLYWVGTDPIVADLAGLNLERDLALADLVEAAAWLLAVFAIEIVVRLQGKGIIEGKIVSAAKITKICMYALILGIGVYWAALSHWVYLWDEIVWIAGFAAIDMNLSEWRTEMSAQAETS